MNGRRTGGFSLRVALENQGVTTEEDMRRHLSLVHGTLAIVPTFDITRYRAAQQSA